MDIHIAPILFDSRGQKLLRHHQFQTLCGLTPRDAQHVIDYQNHSYVSRKMARENPSGVCAECLAAMNQGTQAKAG